MWTRPIVRRKAHRRRSRTPSQVAKIGKWPLLKCFRLFLPEISFVITMYLTRIVSFVPQRKFPWDYPVVCWWKTKRTSLKGLWTRFWVYLVYHNYISNRQIISIFGPCSVVTVPCNAFRPGRTSKLTDWSLALKIGLLHLKNEYAFFPLW